MILFSSKELEIALSNDLLSYWEKTKYLVLVAVIGALLGGPLVLIRPIYGAKMSTLNLLFSSLCAVLSAYLAYRGIKACFLTNEGIDGTLFFERMACLTVPVSIRVGIFMFLISVGLAWSFVPLKNTRPELFKILQNIFFGIALFVKHFK